MLSDVEARSKEFIPGAHYHFLTPVYEVVTRPFLHGIWKASAAEVAKRAPEKGRIVDIGCGPGTVLRLIREKRHDLALEGIDIDPRMIEKAEKYSAGMNISYHTASAGALPIEDQSADIVLSSMVFHHLPLNVKHAAFEETKRILKPGGEFLLCDFSRNEQARNALSQLFWRLRDAVLTTLEPEVKPQIEGQLFELAKGHSAQIETLWFRRFNTGMHSVKFPQKR